MFTVLRDHFSGETNRKRALHLAPLCSSKRGIGRKYSSGSAMCLTSGRLSGVVVGPFSRLVTSGSQTHNGITINQAVHAHPRRLRKLTVENLSSRAPAVTSGHEQHNQAAETPEQEG